LTPQPKDNSLIPVEPHGYKAGPDNLAVLGPARPDMPRTSDTTISKGNAGRILTDRFRCRPEDVADFCVAKDLSGDSGYFRFGPDLICYGQCSSGAPAQTASEPLHDARQQVVANGAALELPFDPVQVVDNLRCERYLNSALPSNRFFRNIYYLLRPLMPVSLRRPFQKLYFRARNDTPFPTWPVDRTVEDIFEQLLVLSMQARQVDRLPFIWFWPQGVRSCTIITHDVETSAGVDFCPKLMDLADGFGIKTSFQIVPEKRYAVSQAFLRSIQDRGFEINIHDLNHDGHLFRDLDQFLHRADQINRYARDFGALGFRSAVMYRNIDWFSALDVSYDMSIPNMARMDPQQGGCCTVLPFFIGQIVELPVTTTQDYSLFYILNDYSTRLWEQEIALIREKHGLLSFIIHPDYVILEKHQRVYRDLLQRLAELRAQGETWIALPGEVAAWWRLRSKLNLVEAGSSLRIEGEGSERATVAYAVLDKGKITYELA
jgi:hypothetical protein